MFQMHNHCYYVLAQQGMNVNFNKVRHFKIKKDARWTKRLQHCKFQKRSKFYEILNTHVFYILVSE